jgi:hypothetical protein
LADKPIDFLVEKAYRENDSSRITPRILIDHEANGETPDGFTKALVIYLDTEDGAFNTTWRASNMRRSEIVALLRYIETQTVLSMMVVEE